MSTATKNTYAGARNSMLAVATANAVHWICISQLPNIEAVGQFWEVGVPGAIVFTGFLVVCAYKLSRGEWCRFTLAFATIFACTGTGLFLLGIGATLYYGNGLPLYLCLAQVCLAVSWWYAVATIARANMMKR